MSRIVVKVGTKVLTNDSGVLARESLARISTQIAELVAAGHSVVLVSSGAMGAGKSILNTTKRLTSISEKQLFAAVGQAHLIHQYSELFKTHDLLCAQVLATKEDFRDKSHFFNMRNCLETLLHDKVVPIVNENDVVALDELTFTDNDELAGLVASMIDADRLIILSSVDGVLDTDGKVISRVTSDSRDADAQHVTADKSEAGRGGMTTKFATAKKLASQGIEVTIANGTMPGIVQEIMDGKQVGTTFVPGKRHDSVKRRLAHSEALVQGTAVINEGAAAALLGDSASSLLLVGVVGISGQFSAGDVITVVDQNDIQLGYGITQYGYEEATDLVGHKNVRPLIHYDYLFIE